MATTATKQPRTAPKAVPPPETDTDTKVAAQRAKKRLSLPKILLLLTLLLGGTGGGAWYFLQDEQPAGPKPAAATTKPVPAKPPVFVTLEPFTVNLQQEGTLSQYLQVGLALKVTDADIVDAIKQHMPEIRNRVLLLLSSKRASEISTLEGKNTLSTELVREILKPLAGRVPAQGLNNVLFTSFVIQ